VVVSGPHGSFEGGSGGEGWTREREHLLSRTIPELHLKLEGSRLEGLVHRLYEELEQAGISFRPRVYLSDEWGCPDLIPIIGVPFYLADARLSKLGEELMEGIEGESDLEILRYLRHETGHAFNYAYKLYATEEWHDLFGPFSRPYTDDYQPNPFSQHFVRHLPGWYAQKHPDEDFSETFAVWLTPESHWQEAYQTWRCYKKLLYVDKVVKKMGRTPPLVSAEAFDPAREENLNVSLKEFYRRTLGEDVSIAAFYDGDAEWVQADVFLSARRRELVRTITHWTGVSDVLVRALVTHFVERCRVLDLWVNPKRQESALLEIAAMATTLSMNKLYKGDFVVR
jgi:hypothetical protein